MSYSDADYSSHLGMWKGDEVVLRGDSLRGLVTKVTKDSVFVLWDGEKRASEMKHEDVLPYNGPETQRTLPKKYRQGPPVRRSA